MSQESKPDKPKVALVRSLAKGEDVKTDTYIWRENASYNTFRTQYHHEYRYPSPEGNLHQTRLERMRIIPPRIYVIGHSPRRGKGGCLVQQRRDLTSRSSGRLPNDWHPVGMSPH